MPHPGAAAAGHPQGIIMTGMAGRVALLAQKEPPEPAALHLGQQPRLQRLCLLLLYSNQTCQSAHLPQSLCTAQNLHADTAVLQAACWQVVCVGGACMCWCCKRQGCLATAHHQPAAAPCTTCLAAVCPGS